MPPVYVSAGHRQHAHPVRQFVRQSVLIVSSTGKVGIETPHRNLLVMERTYYRYMYLQDGVGRSHVRVRRYYTFGVTQIGFGHW